MPIAGHVEVYVCDFHDIQRLLTFSVGKRPLCLKPEQVHLPEPRIFRIILTWLQVSTQVINLIWILLLLPLDKF